MSPLVQSLISTAIGMGVVFSVLVIIILFILGINAIISLFTGKKKDEKIKPITVDEVDEPIKDKKLVAVITAALIASEYSGTKTRFVVKKIRKI